MWNENEYLKSEIEKIEEELERRKIMEKRTKEIEAYLVTYMREGSLMKVETY